MIIKERTQDYIDIANILSKKISNVANNKEYSIDERDMEQYTIIGEYDFNKDEIMGIKYVYCSTITGFKLGNCYNYKMCREFEDA